MVAIIDYGVGNLFSLQASLNKIGAMAVVTNDEAKIDAASHIILPGVGAFEDAAKLLKEYKMDEVILSNAGKKPILGICLGMQLLFDRSFEFGEHKGLGLIAGDIVPLKGAIDSKLKIPHMGWNKLYKTNSSSILKYTSEGDYVYFVHSYYAKAESKYITSVVKYDIDVTATVQNGMVFGTQFHPEKSGECGLRILKAFVEC
ncbi:imidazole glycerol phosphate synthase subunit HisH [Candidatus Epulonipiscium viviparus]|uniref:imidazole glycerol phosphate synthase subunit HisH n=1 Tax=Candidatus Epulonipiscium viviparus TaxID=420336 RepID=UPI0027380EAD|nr:imidazole glycerol phosphate synthase subunit HisH [Candidatus Epulopiscium viviparus]